MVASGESRQITKESSSSVIVSFISTIDLAERLGWTNLFLRFPSVLFYVHSTCVSTDFATARHHSVARHDDRNRISAQRIAYGPNGLWMTDTLRKLAVTGVLAKWNLHRAHQYFALKLRRRKHHIQRQDE